ncbi:MAG TPA: YraN family protein [Candidatus Saccharimonadales bacterium]|nr:YraN family protein [Candidatus Saccharimonadales bacterium]
MKTTSIGRSAEAAVADYLKQNGFTILDKNWRTRWCEIDVIAKKDNAVYFIEVKYRASESQGSGFEYIGPNKLRQLTFASNFWTTQNNWNDDYRIIGAEVTGLNFENIELIEIN